MHNFNYFIFHFISVEAFWTGSDIRVHVKSCVSCFFQTAPLSVCLPFALTSIPSSNFRPSGIFVIRFGALILCHRFCALMINWKIKYKTDRGDLIRRVPFVRNFTVAQIDSMGLVVFKLTTARMVGGDNARSVSEHLKSLTNNGSRP